MADSVDYPDPNDLGYQQARDLGLSLLDAGETAAAIPYLDRTVAIRPTAFVLGRLGSALRDLGRLTDALPRYEEALTLEGRGSIDTHARIGVAAVLCDMGELPDLLNGLEMVKTVLVEKPRESAAHWVAYSICDKAARKFGYDDFHAAALRHKAAAKAYDPRSDEERRSHQLRRAVKVQRSRTTPHRVPQSEPGIPDPKPVSGPDHAGQAASDQLSAGTLRRLARWLAARIRR